jgi:hypothetical protein
MLISTLTGCGYSQKEKTYKNKITELNQEIVSKLHYNKSKGCKQEIIFEIKDIGSLDKYAIAITTVGAKIVKKKEKYIITPECENDKYFIEVSYYTEKGEIIIQRIDFKELITN